MSDGGHSWWWPHSRDRAWRAPEWSREAQRFHRALADYTVTPLVELPSLAEAWQVGAVVAKDESARLGLPAFKGLGASWALHRVLQRARPIQHAHDSLPDVVTFVTATDGNHGRAVAHFAAMWGHRALVFIPEGVHSRAVDAIRDEGAEVRLVHDDYDSAVAAAAAACDQPNHLLVQDTAWGDFTEVPHWIVEGYSTLFAELDDQCRAILHAPVGLVMLPVGVGSLAQAAVGHYRAEDGPALVTVEPDSAACALASLRAGRSIRVSTGTTIMTGLNCGTLSESAWPWLQRGIDGAVIVTDDQVRRALPLLQDLGLSTGPCGAAGLVAMQQLLTGDGASQRRAHLGIGADTVVAFLITEGADANPNL